MRYQVLVAAAGATGLLGVLVYCSPTAAIPDTSDAAVGVCDDSGAYCPCDPGKYKAPIDCYTGTRGTNGKGVCVTGKRTCTGDGIWTDCTGEITPTAEVCDYLDNDCDGIVDDVPGTSALSPDAGGAVAIDYCQSASCDPTYTDAGIACWAGTTRNVCKAGNKVCGPGRQTACQAFSGIVPTPELCNGWDDDCNDLIDDSTTDVGKCTIDPEAGTLFPDGAVPVGECLNSTSSCDDGGLDCPPSDPTPEKCDNKDNDCNGLIDDHACASSSGSPYCCHYSSSFFCAPSYYTQYSFYTCVNAQ
jgi:hypothetical protein